MADLPATPPLTPGFPSNPTPLTFEKFSTLNTKPLRPGINDDQMYWCDGFMPLGQNNLRTLYDVGDSLYTASGTTVSFFGFGNCGQTIEDQHLGTPFMYVVLGDGGIDQVDTNTGTVTEVAPAGTITSSAVGMSQYGNSYIIFVADQENGYFLWDGVSFYQSGTLAPDITITNAGAGYTSAPAISFTGGSGSGATATAVVENESVVNIYITDPGSGWVDGDSVTVVFTGGGGSGAAATINIMPFGIQGTAVETYTSHVWVSWFEQISFTAPASVSDFSEANGGGTFVSNDSFLRVGYTALKQSNGFLYLIGDSSMNYISGVQTGGSPTATTFNNQNVDPQVGSPYPNSVQVFSRNIVFANSLGIYVSYGGAVTKVSEPMDGIFNTVANFGGASLYSAVANIFNIPVYMCLVPIVDTYTAQQVNKLLMWDGRKWWTSGQSATLTQIATQEDESRLTAWGTDGTDIYPLFQNSSSAFRKVAQSKLWSTPWYFFTKTSTRLFGIVNFFEETDEELEITIDSELGVSPSIAAAVGATLTWYNNLEEEISWENDVGQPIVWGGPSLIVFKQSVGQQGSLIGMTAVTNAPDMAIISLTVLNQTFSTDL
jgi:hypothetical protein